MSKCISCEQALRASKRAAAFKLYGGTDPVGQIKLKRPPEGTPCGICTTPMVYRRCSHMVCFDHDPNTHTFRGWLCQKCNTSLGGLGDTLESLQRAVHYLSTKH